MTRKNALALIRIAGYHGDTAAFTRLYVENRIGYKAADAAWAEGARAHTLGFPCSCAACAAHYGDDGPCDEGKPVNSPHRRRP